MAFINQILGALQTATAAQPGAAAAPAPAVGSPLANVVAQMMGGQASGLSGLVQKFEAAGLSNVIQSWVGTGTNLPINTEQLQQALGAEHLSQLAQTAGLNKDQLLQQLSAALPGVIDALTPGGKMPGAAGGFLNSVLSQFTGKPTQP